MPHLLDGPRIAPAAGGAPHEVIVFLHGYGADGNDLISLAQEWSRALPHAAFISPNGPEPCAGAPFGFQWFPLSLRDPAEFWRGAKTAAAGLDAFIDQILAATELPPSRLALVGFSQGTMMALHVGLRRRKALGAIIGYSGLLPGAEHLKRQAASKPPVLLVHGAQDEVLPVQALFLASQALAEAEIPVQWHVSHGVGHGIDPEGLALGGDFLSRIFVGD